MVYEGVVVDEVELLVVVANRKSSRTSEERCDYLVFVNWRDSWQRHDWSVLLGFYRNTVPYRAVP